MDISRLLVVLAFALVIIICFRFLRKPKKQLRVSEQIVKGIKDRYRIKVLNISKEEVLGALAELQIGGHSLEREHLVKLYPNGGLAIMDEFLKQGDEAISRENRRASGEGAKLISLIYQKKPLR